MTDFETYIIPLLMELYERNNDAYLQVFEHRFTPQEVEIDQNPVRCATMVHFVTPNLEVGGSRRRALELLEQVMRMAILVHPAFNGEVFTGEGFDIALVLQGDRRTRPQFIRALLNVVRSDPRFSGTEGLRYAIATPLEALFCVMHLMEPEFLVPPGLSTKDLGRIPRRVPGPELSTVRGPVIRMMHELCSRRLELVRIMHDLMTLAIQSHRLGWMDWRDVPDLVRKQFPNGTSTFITFDHLNGLLANDRADRVACFNEIRNFYIRGRMERLTEELKKVDKNSPAVFVREYAFEFYALGYLGIELGFLTDRPVSMPDFDASVSFSNPHLTQDARPRLHRLPLPRVRAKQEVRTYYALMDYMRYRNEDD